MDANFEKKVTEWFELIKQNRKDEASDYYWKNIFPDNAKIFKKKVEEKMLENYSTLISIVGFSPEPVIYTILALKPENVRFIVSPETRKQIDFIVEKTSLRPSQYQWREVDSSNIEDVYAVIREFKDLSKEGQIAVDITGGKKSMVGGAAQAAALLGFDVFYVDFSEYQKELRKPKPGTEHISKLKNPFEIFGDIEQERAAHLYKKGNYSAAVETMARLEMRIPDKKKVEIRKNVYSMYLHWEDYRFDKARKSCDFAVDKIEQYGIFRQILPKLQERKNILEEILSGDHRWIILNHYHMASTYFSRGKYDFAVLLLYRTLEQTFSFRLQKEYGIDNSSPDFSNFPDLLNRYNELLPEIYGSEARITGALPPKIGLMDAATILYALEDELVKDASLKNIRTQADFRNLGILAHGLQPNTEKQFKSMRDTFLPIIKKMVSLYFPEDNFDALIKKFSIIDI